MKAKGKNGTEGKNSDKREAIKKDRHKSKGGKGEHRKKVKEAEKKERKEKNVEETIEKPCRPERNRERQKNGEEKEIKGSPFEDRRKGEKDKRRRTEQQPPIWT